MRDQWFQRPVLLHGYYKLATNDRKVEKYPLFYCDDMRIVRNDAYYYYFFETYKFLSFGKWVMEDNVYILITISLSYIELIMDDYRKLRP